MYSIQYYKKKRTKPTLEIPNFSSDRKSNSMARVRYLHQKDVIDKCWNIKSLTIDIDDIKNVIYDDRLKHLISLYAKINRLNINEIDSITILNNNGINMLYIYEIINCDWMIEKDKAYYSEELLLEKIRELNRLIEKYENSKSQSDKNKLRNRIRLFEYWMNSLNDKNTSQKSEQKVLKLGKHIIKRKQGTIN